MTEVGAVWSVEAVAGMSPDCSVPGWMPMSANKLTIACCTRGSVGVACEVVIVAQAPGPVDRAGTEDQRAARSTIERQVVG